MTDDLNLRLAQYFEPEPKWANESEPYRLYYTSKKGCWWKGNGYTQEVRDFTKEPDLLKMMLEWAGKTWVVMVWYLNDGWTVKFDQGLWAAHDDLQTAVCHATLKAIESERGRG